MIPFEDEDEEEPLEDDEPLDEPVESPVTEGTVTVESEVVVLDAAGVTPVPS